MTAYIPHAADFLDVAASWGVGAVLLLAGAGLTGRRVAPEYQIIAGWGALCLVLTLWGVFVPLSLRLPAGVFIVAAAGVLLTARRPGGEAWRAVARVLALSAPLWLVLAPIRPSQPDTFLNLLPNAAYLVDYARLPTALLPPSHSLLPGAPYNTQFLSFIGSFVTRDFPAGGMSLINLMLQLVGALAIARALDTRPGSAQTAPSWGMIAAGILLVTLLNPGFVPRVDLAAYGEPALAAAALIAALGFVGMQGEEAAGRHLGPFALALAALVNTKQSGLGLVAALAGAALAVAWVERETPRARAVRRVGTAVVPAVLLYLVWRYYIAHAGVAELRLLPIAEWNWRIMPAAFASILATVAEKPVYFACVGAAFVALGVLHRRQGWTPTTRLLGFHAALFFFYNAFIVLTYVALFAPGMAIEAHSYFRYNTHLSLVLVLSLALAARDLGVGGWLAHGAARPAAAGAILLILLAPVGFIKRLRFDLDMPQPLAWNLAKHTAERLHDGDRLALLLPGDNGSLAAMIAGVLRDTAPRRPYLDLLSSDTADAATLDDAARRGYGLALISCTPPDLAGLPAGQAVLLRHGDDGWHEVASWPYPALVPGQHWQQILTWAPLCRFS